MQPLKTQAKRANLWYNSFMKQIGFFDESNRLKKLRKAAVMEDLFNLFNRQLEQKGIISHKGTIVDATFVEALRQRNTREESRQIKEGNTPEEWDKPENVNKVRQKDTDARWTTKNKERHFGYKDHIKVDADSKLITAYSVTDA